MERVKIMPVLLSNQDANVLMESLRHTCQRWDIPDEDRERARELRQKLGKEFNVEGAGCAT